MTQCLGHTIAAGEDEPRAATVDHGSRFVTHRHGYAGHVLLPPGPSATNWKGTLVSTDEEIATSLIRTLENGKEGFGKAAEKLDNSNRSDVAMRFREFAQERAMMSDELKVIAASYGDEIAQRGTVPGALHRGWIAVKDALSSDDADAVIAAAETGEDHAVDQYREALEADISPEFRAVVARHSASVQAAHDYVRSLKSKS